MLYGTSGAKQLTVSFWIKSPKTGTHICELRHNDATFFNSQAYTISSANTWQNVTLTYDGYVTTAFDDDTNHSLGIHWWFASGSNFSSGTLNSNTWHNTATNRAVGQVNCLDSTSNEIYLTGVQVEVGSVATEFEHQKYCDVYKDCQRYYYKSGDNAASGNEWFPGVATNANRGYYYALALESVIDRAYPALQWPVQMRTAPSVTFYPGRSGVTNTADRITLYNADTLVTFTQSPFPYSNGITDIFLGTSTDSSAYSYQVIADAEL